MNVLAVDTCLEPGSLALISEDVPSSGDGCAAGEPEVVALPPGWRSVALHEEIRQLLARHGLTTANIDLYAVTAGPGAFTGVRLGLTAVKGLAEVHDKPIIPVSTLEALASSAVYPSRDRKGAGTGNNPRGEATSGPDQEPTTESLVTRHSSLVTVFAPVLDARRGQIFGAVYATEGPSGEGADFHALIPDSVCSLRSFLNQVKAAGLTTETLKFCVTDEALLLPAIEEFGWTADSLVRVSPQLAGTVARMAAARFRQGKGIGALAADANYVRASDAELFWKES